MERGKRKGAIDERFQRAGLQAPTANTPILRALVEENIFPSIDVMRLARLTLGKHWRTSTTAQRERFTNEFRQLLIRTYSTSLTEYSGQ